MNLGTKRICESCNKKFYDLDKRPVICPACSTVASKLNPVIS